MRKFLLIGPSGVGKSYCVMNLRSEYVSLDLDQGINTRNTHDPSKLVKLISGHKAQIVAVSVIKSLLEYLLNIKNNTKQKLNGYYFIYLMSNNPIKHKSRLLKMPTVGKKRSIIQIQNALNSVKYIDEICANLADSIINVDELKAEEVVEVIIKLMKINESMDNTKLQFLTREEYNSTAKSIGGPHWASAGSRWVYHILAVKWAKELMLSSNQDVLELGTMGVTIVKNSDTVDYDPSKNNQQWCTVDSKPTFVHDARSMPWPFQDKSYELFVALRVFHHLKPTQKECFLEAKRISKAMIMIVPSKNVHPRGIDKQELISWNAGVKPEKEHNYEGVLGSCFLWKW